MGETYDFPDWKDIPKIRTTTDETFRRPETKHIFIQYSPDEWDNDDDAHRAIETINYLFGQDVQITVLPDDFSLLDSDEVEDMLERILND